LIDFVGMAIIAYLPTVRSGPRSTTTISTSSGANHSRRAVPERLALTRRSGWALNCGHFFV